GYLGIQGPRPSASEARLPDGRHPLQAPPRPPGPRPLRGQRQHGRGLPQDGPPLPRHRIRPPLAPHHPPPPRRRRHAPRRRPRRPRGGGGVPMTPMTTTTAGRAGDGTRAARAWVTSVSCPWSQAASVLRLGSLATLST